jgi:hypothetical protein
MVRACRRHGWRHLLLTVTGALALLLAVAAPAGAHTTGPQFPSIFDSISPPAPGVQVTLRPTESAPYLTIRVRGTHTVEVLGLEGEPFARIGAEGAFVNQRSPSLYLTEDSEKRPPRRRDQGLGAPDWKRVSPEPVFNYFDPRAEWPHSQPPEDVRRLGERVTVFRWEIPALYDGQPIVLKGHVDWVPGPLNVEMFLLPIPLVFVALWWLEPRIKRFAGPLGRALAPVMVAALAVEGVWLLLEVTSAGHALSRAAPLALVPGLVMAGIAARLLWRADRRGYRAALAFGAYLLVFGLLRTGLSPGGPEAAEWLRRIEVALGSLVLLGGVVLVFLTRGPRPQPR